MRTSGAVTIGVIWTMFSPAAPAEPAREILDAAGVKGGLVVHLGCGDGKLTAGLAAGEGYLVHALEADAANVAAARRHIRSKGLTGRASVERWTQSYLPYADNLVALLVAEDLGEVGMEEVMRVLRPGGVAYVRATGGEGGRDRRSLGEGGWRKTVKPIPAGLDGWTHTLYDASNNAVGGDTLVGPPHHVQWLARPRNARHHERLASVSGVVSGGGRLFYVIDEAPTASVLIEPRWSLLARDAFSGVRLWRRPIGGWENHLRGFRSGPAGLSRRLVASGKSVYATLGYGKPLTALDAATGKTVRTYEGTDGTEEIRLHEGTLYLVVAAPAGEGKPARPARSIVALDAATGRVLWQRADAQPLTTTLAVAGPRVFYQDAEAVHCLNAATGRPLWRSPRPAAVNRPGWSAPTLVATPKVVLSADRLAKQSPSAVAEARKKHAAWLVAEGPPGELVAFSAETGKPLWRCDCAETYHAPVDVFVVGGLVWVGQSSSRTGPDFTVGRDLLTGEVRKRIDPARAFRTTMPHHRCHRNRATGHYLVTGRTGVEFIDLRTGDVARHHWVRGVCQYGVLPCNGLLYTPPHSCACYIEAKLAGFYALAPASFAEAPEARARDDGPRLERGPAYGIAENPQSAIPNPQLTGWPTYRHDGARSGATRAAVDADLTCLWQAKLPARPSSPVVAAGRAFVAAVDAHAVCAFDAATGRPIWQHTAGGRVDSPPTVCAGRVVFGSADGYLRCLRAADGQVVWRFRAAPRERRIVASGQVESAWPVHGSVLVGSPSGASPRPSVSFVAGRSSYLDGGLALWRLDLETGKVLARERIYSRDPQTGAQPDEPQSFDMPGALPDVLSGDGERVYMRRRTLDPATLKPASPRAHLYSPAGFLNGEWWHRTYWIYGTHFYSGYIGWYFAGREAPAGRLLVLDERSIYGFGYTPAYYRGSTGRQYHLFAADRSAQQPQPAQDYTRARREYPARGVRKFRPTYRWSRRVRLLARAMVLAGERLFLAGPPDMALRSEAALAGEQGGRLAVVSAADGKTIRDYELDCLPVFDGLAAAGGRLYVSSRDGRLLCLGRPTGGATTAPGKPSPIRPLGAGVPRPPETKEPGLVGCWPLDEGRGTVACDSSGGRHDGDVYGRWVKGTYGTALRTGGKAGALTLPDGPHLHVAARSFSVAFWLSAADFDRRIMGKENYPRRWWVINLLKDGRLEMVLGQGRGKGESVRPRARTPLTRKAWAHVAFVVDREARQVRCYLNGTLDSRTAIPPELTADLSVAGTDLRVPSSHKPFSGLFDELRLYARRLTDAEVRAICEKGKPGRARPDAK